MKINRRLAVSGTDIFATHPKFLCHGLDMGVADSVLVTANPTRSLTETRDGFEPAKTLADTAVISRRSGEPEDATIAVATHCGRTKPGSLRRADRRAESCQRRRDNEVDLTSGS